MTLCRLMLLLSAALLLSGCDRSVGWLDHQGVALDREQLQGQRVLVNFWAEWCAPCRDELPELNRLVAELRAQGLINWTGGQVEILDWPRLAAIAEFDPAYLRLQRDPV